MRTGIGLTSAHAQSVQYDSASGIARHWLCEQKVACVALTEQGHLIAGMESGIFELRLSATSDQVEACLLVSPPKLGPGQRFNDGRCDRQGSFWSGTMAIDTTTPQACGHLYRYDARHGRSAPLVSELRVQNGLAWSPDGRTMDRSDSHPSRRVIWAFNYEIANGTPSRQRVFVDMLQYFGRPDGAAMDIDGGYWTCANDSACLLRFTPTGKLDRTITLPVAKPSMCSFGGSGMDTLLETSIRAGAPAGDTLAGTVLMLKPDTISPAAVPR